MIYILSFVENVCDTILYMIYQCDWEPVLITAAHNLNCTGLIGLNSAGGDLAHHLNDLKIQLSSYPVDIKQFQIHVENLFVFRPCQVYPYSQSAT